MIATTMARYDLAQRFGAEVFRPLRRARPTLMIISGTITKKMAPAGRAPLQPDGRAALAIAMGACAISAGGPFKQG